MTSSVTVLAELSFGNLQNYLKIEWNLKIILLKLTIEKKQGRVQTMDLKKYRPSFSSFENHDVDPF